MTVVVTDSVVTLLENFPDEQWKSHFSVWPFLSKQFNWCYFVIAPTQAQAGDIERLVHDLRSSQDLRVYEVKWEMLASYFYEYGYDLDTISVSFETSWIIKNGSLKAYFSDFYAWADHHVPEWQNFVQACEIFT